MRITGETPFAALLAVWLSFLLEPFQVQRAHLPVPPLADEMSAAQPSIKARYDVHLDEGECRLCKHAAMPSGERSAPSATQCAFVSSSHDGRGAVRQERSRRCIPRLRWKRARTVQVVSLRYSRVGYELVRGEFVRGAISIRELYAYSPQ